MCFTVCVQSNCNKMAFLLSFTLSLFFLTFLLIFCCILKLTSKYHQNINTDDEIDNKTIGGPKQHKIFQVGMKIPLISVVTMTILTYVNGNRQTCQLFRNKMRDLHT